LLPVPIQFAHHARQAKLIGNPIPKLMAVSQKAVLSQEMASAQISWMLVTQAEFPLLKVFQPQNAIDTATFG
jgi:hypothetical protein